MGREEEGNQGTVYYKGRKLGFYSYDGNGGCPDFYFPIKEIDDAVFAYKQKLKGAKSYQFFDTDGFMTVLIALSDLEKDWKAGCKKGKNYLSAVIDMCSGTSSYISVADLTTARNYMPLLKKDLLEYSFIEEKYMICGIFKNQSDFDLTIGKLGNKKKDTETDEIHDSLGFNSSTMVDPAIAKLQDIIRGENKTASSHFVFNNKGNSEEIVDTHTGKKVVVPLFALKEIKRVLEELDL